MVNITPHPENKVQYWERTIDLDKKHFLCLRCGKDFFANSINQEICWDCKGIPFVKKETQNPERIKKLEKIWVYTAYHKKEFLLSRGNKCECCKTKEHLEIHHKEYTINFSDWQLLCRGCHRKKHTK